MFNNPLYLFFFERLVNKRPSKIAYLFQATAWQKDDFGYTTMTALLEDVGS
jgi:hypothetical protein